MPASPSGPTRRWTPCFPFSPDGGHGAGFPLGGSPDASPGSRLGRFFQWEGGGVPPRPSPGSRGSLRGVGAIAPGCGNRLGLPSLRGLHPGPRRRPSALRAWAGFTGDACRLPCTPRAFGLVGGPNARPPIRTPARQRDGAHGPSGHPGAKGAQTLGRPRKVGPSAPPWILAAIKWLVHLWGPMDRVAALRRASPPWTPTHATAHAAGQWRPAGAGKSLRSFPRV